MVNPDVNINWDEVRRQDDINCIQRSVDEVKNIQLLQLKVNTILTKLFSGEELDRAKAYEGAITRFLIENIRIEALRNDNILQSIVKVYYKTLTTEKAHVNDYLFLQKYTKEYSSEIRSHLQNRYDESKNDLLFEADLFDVETTDDTDDMLAQILAHYENQQILNRVLLRICERSKQFGDSSDRIVLADTKKIHDAYETIITLRNNNIYVVRSDKERKQLHF